MRHSSLTPSNFISLLFINIPSDTKYEDVGDGVFVCVVSAGDIFKMNINHNWRGTKLSTATVAKVMAKCEIGEYHQSTAASTATAVARPETIQDGKRIDNNLHQSSEHINLQTECERESLGRK